MSARAAIGWVALVVWGTLTVAGCDDGGDDAAVRDAEIPRREVTCVLGVPLAVGPFAPLADAGTLELYVGFQGFLVVTPRLWMAEPGPLTVEVRTSIELDGEQPFGGVLVDTELAPDGAGGAVSGDLVLFLTPSELGHFKDRSARLAVRVIGAQIECTAEVRIRFVDEDNCIHADDAPVCEAP